MPPINRARAKGMPKVSQGGGATASSDGRPSFESMDVSELKKRMAHFGLRPGSKSMMVQKLAQMWDRMHDGATADSERGASAASAGSASYVAAPVSTPALALGTKPHLDSTAVRQFIEADQELYDSMLLHEEVNVPELRARLKDAGIPCGSDAELAKFLREEGAVVRDWKE